MNFTDFKIYALNGSTMLISFTNADAILKITLLLTSIGYTLHKWYLMNKDEKNK
tara:strand:- start:638 stop:799 length:162 start_codon:yes stop_codon:yes gene_type:complete